MSRQTTVAPGDAGTTPAGDRLEEIWAGLSRFSRCEDANAGRAEEQAFIDTPAGPVFVTLVEPLGRRRDVGFLVCHSFAFEQLDLFPLELTFARFAASSGFPVLYLQARGYADSGGDLGEATATTQLRDTLAAAEHLRARGHVRHVVPVGVRWGGAIALMAADRLDAPGVALWNPAVEPGAYLDDLLRVFSRSRIAGKGRDPAAPEGPSRQQLRAMLEQGGQVDLFGFPLTSRCYGDAASVHPLDTSSPAPGQALVVVVNPRVRPEVERTARRLRERGAEVHVDEAEGPGRAQFALGASPAGRRVVAGQTLFEDVARRTVDWALERWDGVASEPVVSNGGAAASTAPVDPAPRPEADVLEVPVYVDSRGERLGAVVTVPRDGGSTLGVVLLASRARDRAHRNGMWVKAARTLAGDGLYVLRLDYPGVGNSTGSPRMFGMEDMPSWAVDDACAFLIDHTPVRRILLAGTCYGARVVLDAAPRIPTVDGVAMIVGPIMRPLSSRTKLRFRLAGLIGRRARGKDPAAEAGRPAPGARAQRRRIDPAFVRTLKRYLARGRVYFLYGDRDVYWEELRFTLQRLRLTEDRHEVDLVPGEIDSFRSIDMQAIARDRLVAWCRRAAAELREVT